MRAWLSLKSVLSPYLITPTDSYGGVLENRARFVFEVLDAVRETVGADYPVLIKINSCDFMPDSFSAEDCLEVCRNLEARGLDAVELSGGIPPAGPKLFPVRIVDVEQGGSVYYEEAAKRIKQALRIPVLLVGGIRYPEKALALVEDGVCDMISLSRPLIREPGLLARWLAGDKTRAACVSCEF